MSTTQEPTEHQFLVTLSKHLVEIAVYFVSIPNGWPCIATNIYNTISHKVLLDTNKPHCGQQGENDKIDLVHIEICQKVKYI